jgi:hypothetical protein
MYQVLLLCFLEFMVLPNPSVFRQPANEVGSAFNVLKGLLRVHHSLGEVV